MMADDTVKLPLFDLLSKTDPGVQAATLALRSKRPAPGHTFLPTKEERPAYLDEIGHGGGRGAEEIEIDDLIWEAGPDLQFEIDEEFKNLHPKLTLVEAAKLTGLLDQKGGVSEFLTVARIASEAGRLILADGHQRLDLWLNEGYRHGWRAPQYLVMDFESRDAAKEWADHYQRGRRNLNRTRLKYALGKEYLKKKQQGARHDLDDTSGQNGQRLTAEALASKETSPRTVHRYADFARALDKIDTFKPGGAKLAKRILDEEIILKDNEVTALADYPDVVKKASERADATEGYIRHLLREANRAKRFGKLIEQGTPPPGEDWGKGSRLEYIPPDPGWRAANWRGRPPSPGADRRCGPRNRPGLPPRNRAAVRHGRRTAGDPALGRVSGPAQLPARYRGHRAIICSGSWRTRHRGGTAAAVQGTGDRTRSKPIARFVRHRAGYSAHGEGVIHDGWLGCIDLDSRGDGDGTGSASVGVMAIGGAKGEGPDPWRRSGGHTKANTRRLSTLSTFII
jgi:hypothetical protein